MQRRFQMTFQGLLTGVLLLCFSARAETPLIPLPPGMSAENSNRDVAVGSPVSLTGPEVQRDEPPSGEYYGNCGYGNYITPWLL